MLEGFFLPSEQDAEFKGDILLSEESWAGAVCGASACRGGWCRVGRRTDRHTDGQTSSSETALLARVLRRPSEPKARGRAETTAWNVSSVLLTYSSAWRTASPCVVGHGKEELSFVQNKEAGGHWVDRAATLPSRTLGRDLASGLPFLVCTVEMPCLPAPWRG